MFSYICGPIYGVYWWIASNPKGNEIQEKKYTLTHTHTESWLTIIECRYILCGNWCQCGSFKQSHRSSAQPPFRWGTTYLAYSFVHLDIWLKHTHTQTHRFKFYDWHFFHLAILLSFADNKNISCIMDGMHVV